MTLERATDATYPTPPKPPDSPELPEVLLPADYGDTHLRAAVAAGELTRVAKGVYMRPPNAGAEEWQVRHDIHLGRAVAVNRHFGESVVLSHATAALLHGLWAPIEDHPYVTHAFHSHKAPGPAPRCIRVCRPLGEGDVVVIRGLRVTSLERTVLDCVATLSAPWALAVADSAMRHLIDADRTRPELAHERARPIRLLWQRGVEARGPRRGRRQARAIVGLASGLSESSGESRTRCVAVAAGLPLPQLQTRVELDWGGVYTDLGFRVHGAGDEPAWVHVEYDGAVKYQRQGSERVVQEKAREDEIRALPSTRAVVRVVNADLAWPQRERLVQRIARECRLPLPLRPIPELNPLPPRAAAAQRR